MISKIMLFLILAAYAIHINAQSNGKKAIKLYHPCQRPSVAYSQLYWGGESNV